ncbi:hypothetical protein [Virgibacillus sp. Bac330]|uniref:hypothetical protein n=1 Tax=Virgibacillus sp. Bac330 TaxID=2419841 RepID=UPI0013CEE576|nr:hypothetical protein [Virgibacillus sp. Bac330]
MEDVRNYHILAVLEKDTTFQLRMDEFLLKTMQKPKTLTSHGPRYSNDKEL